MTWDLPVLYWALTLDCLNLGFYMGVISLDLGLDMRT